MSGFSKKQLGALNLAGAIDKPVAFTAFPAFVGHETIAHLAARGLLSVSVSITPKGREALQRQRSARAVERHHEQMQSRLRKASQAELMGAR
ncbi:MAG TPA: hypothetical protein VHZ78_08765 [Rhizomicrobium sp.]|jgi:hypothetical protein|nr:hypothetical protein [Rhizomicrobium sp.]